MFLPTLTIAILLQSATAAPADLATRLVAERRVGGTFTDGVLDLRSGDGWFRFERPVLDFEASFEIRALSGDAAPGLVLRSWTGQRQWPDAGYRLSLPTGHRADPADLLVARGQKVEVVRTEALRLQPAGEWQRVRVTGEATRVVVTVNDQITGEYRVETYGGFLLFDNQAGRVELRHIKVVAKDVNETIPADVRRLSALKAEGVVTPKLLSRVQPVYTPDAMRARVQGSVVLEAVVRADGTIGPVRVVKPLHPELDVAAVAALKAWRFEQPC